MKKVILMAGCALVLAACTQKSATPTTDTNTVTNTPVAATRTPAATAKPESTSSSMMDDGKYTFKLAAQSNSKQDGTVTLQEVNKKVKVTIEVANATAASEPAHIHVGKCPNPGEVKYPLTAVVNGKSETTLPADVTMEKLMAMGDLAVNLHKSATDLKTYMACGNLDWKSAGALTSAKPSASVKASASASAKASATASAKASASPSAQ